MTLPEVQVPPRQDAEWLPEVVTARRPLRWLAAAGVLVVLAMVASALVTNPAWEWPVVGQYLFAPSVVRSVLLTLELTALGIVL
ncbi:amino acid ABC transporter permease, partial [Nonomuraea angiospora]